MLSVSNILCGHSAGNEALRYGHHRLESETPKPVVVWAVTKACNLRCVHCYASAEPHAAPNELSHAEGRKLLDDLASFGVPAVLFSGGEPLVRPDVEDLIGYALSLGLRCTLSTNGVLIDEAQADRLAALGLQYVGISLDGNQQRHDKLRGMKGAYHASLDAIDRCRARGMKVGLRFTVHGLNHEDLDEIFNLCLDHDVQRLCIYHLAYAGRGGGMRKVDLTADQTRSVVDRIFHLTDQCHKHGESLEVLTVGNHADAGYALMQLEQQDAARATDAWSRLRGTGGNRSGCNIASIDPLGGVHYDQFSWHYTCGNIRDESFSSLWTEAADNRLAVLRDRRANLPARCQSCRFLDVCNGNLRTRAEAATGDWLGLDPACYLTDEEILTVEQPLPVDIAMPETRTITSRVTDPPLELDVNDEAFQPNPTTVRFARAVKVEPGDVVFDIGTGIGPLAIMAAQAGASQVIAVDPVRVHCELAKRNATKYGLDDVVRVEQGGFFEPFNREPELHGLRAQVIIGDVSGIADAAGRALGWYPDDVPAGGFDGTEVLLEFLRQAPPYLAPGGRLYFPIAVDLSDGEKILEEARALFKNVDNALAKPYVEFPLTPEHEQALIDAYGGQLPKFIQIQRTRRLHWRGQILVATEPRIS